MVPSLFALINAQLLYLHDFNPELTRRAFRAYKRRAAASLIVMLAFATVIVIFGETSPLTAAGLYAALGGAPLLLQYRELKRNAAQKKKRILLELPIFLNKVMLLVNAGETVQRAILRCAENIEDDADDPFARQLVIARKQLANMYPFAQVLDELSRRCGVHEATVFVTAVMMNYRRGGEAFVSALRRLSGELWEKRKATVKTLGEEASSKMIFPLLIIFLLVMILVGAPAIMMI